MSCQQTQAFLVDETAPRPADLDAHLASCAECRDFRRAHTAAMALRGAPLGRTTRPPVERIRRRAGIVAGLALVVVSVAGLIRLEASPVPLPSSDFLETPRLEAAPVPVEAAVDEVAEWHALARLEQTVRLASQSDPTRDDLTYRSFGSLPAWLAPETTRPVRALGRAISPVVYTREY